MPSHILQSLPFSAGSGRTRAARLWQRLWGLLSRGAAGIGAGHFSMRLAAGQELRVHDAAGWTVACRGGSVWITQEADTRDIFLDAGERFTLDRGGLALILARQGSSLAISPPAAGASRRTETSTPDACPAPDSARDIWLKAVYPECGPWSDPAAYRRSGLL